MVNNKTDVLDAVNKGRTEEYFCTPGVFEHNNFAIKASTNGLTSIGISIGDELIFINTKDIENDDICFVEYQGKRLLRRITKLSEAYLLENDEENRFAPADKVVIHGVLDCVIKRVNRGKIGK